MSLYRRLPEAPDRDLIEISCHSGLTFVTLSSAGSGCPWSSPNDTECDMLSTSHKTGYEPNLEGHTTTLVQVYFLKPFQFTSLTLSRVCPHTFSRIKVTVNTRVTLLKMLIQIESLHESCKDASWLLFSSHTLHRLLEHRFVSWQSMGEELLEQIGIMSLSYVWVTPVIPLPVSTVRDCRGINPRGRKAGHVLDSVEEVDLPSG